MNSVEIARNQLSRLSAVPRRKRKSRVDAEKPITEILNKKSIGDLQWPPVDSVDSVELEILDVPELTDMEPNAITYEWNDDTCEIFIPRELQTKTKSEEPTTTSVPQVVKKTIVWAPPSSAPGAAIVTERRLSFIESPPTQKKRRTTEVDKLLADEGVQAIMRDQDRRLQKAESQEYNVCALIARRRSSSFSTESLVVPEETSLVEVENADNLDTLRDHLTSPKTMNFLHRLKYKMDKTSPKSLESILEAEQDPELNNNNQNICPQKAEPQAGKPKRGKTLTPPKPTPSTSSNDKKSVSPSVKVSPSSKFKLLQVRPRGEFVQVKIFGGLSSTVCQELVACLDQLKADPKCRLVLLGPIKFSSSEKNVVSKDFEQTWEFLEALATFPKAIFAAVQGNVEGVGVTMLPLFDLTFAKYGAEFCCAKDPVPGMSILMSSSKVDKNRMSEILYLGKSATSTLAVTYGLITREISSRSDKDFEEKVLDDCKEALKARNAERIRIVKKIWGDSHLTNLIKDLNREASLCDI